MFFESGQIQKIDGNSTFTLYIPFLAWNSTLCSLKKTYGTRHVSEQKNITEFNTLFKINNKASVIFLLFLE